MIHTRRRHIGSRSERAGAKCWNSIHEQESFGSMFCVDVSTAQKWKTQQQWLAPTNQPKKFVSVCNLCRIQHFIFAVFFQRRIHRFFIILLHFIERGHLGMNSPPQRPINRLHSKEQQYTHKCPVISLFWIHEIELWKKERHINGHGYIFHNFTNGQRPAVYAASCSYIPISGRCRCQFLFDDIQNKIHADVRSVLFIWFLIDVRPSLGKSRTVWLPCWNVHIYRNWRERR